jgi:hypothetical protein
VTRSDDSGNGWLQHATQVVGLLAALATTVYLTGGIVMALRLRFEDLPWGNVVSQLPREFLISIGAGQVLFPSLLVGLLYGLYRLARRERPDVPRAYGLREGWAARSVLGARYIATFALLSTPLALVMAFSTRSEAHNEVPLEFLMVAAVLFLLAAVAVQEVRDLIVERCRGVAKRWNSVRVVATLAVVYAATAIPAAMLAAAAVPLNSAMVCDVDNFSESGFLVGETSDRVYLGEEGRKRRIGVIPMTKVGELFIGDEAAKAHCELVSAPPTATERRKMERHKEDPRSKSFLTPD